MVRALITVALAAFAAVPPAFASSSRERVFGGAVTLPSLGGGALYLTTDSAAGHLKGLGVTYIAPCAPGDPVPLSVDVRRATSMSPLPAPAASPAGALVVDQRAGGQFTAQLRQAVEGDRDAVLLLTGRITGLRASGTIRTTFLTRGAPICSGKAYRWHAVRLPGRVFGGRMGTAGTVVVRRLGTRDMEFHTSLVTRSCQDGPAWLVPDIGLSGFDIVGRSFTQHVDDTLFDVSAHVHYLVKGKVGERRAGGSFGGHIDGFDSSGQTTWTCTIPTTRWSAHTG
jgi:hypothetical protein